MKKMKKSKKATVIDGNHLMHRAYNKFNAFKGRSGPTSIIYGFTHILQSLVRTHQPDFLIVVFDGKRDAGRLAILPDYKERKKATDFDYEDFQRQKKILVKLLQTLRIPVILEANREADDIIWLVSRRLKSKGYFIEIVSADKDFNQLIDDKIRIWNPYKNSHIHHKNVEKIAGYKAERCVEYLIMAGDSSDNIPGLKGIGDKRAKEFLSRWESIPAYLESDQEDKGFSKEAVRYIWETRELVDIRLFCRKHKISLKDIKVKKIPSKLDIAKLRNLCFDHTITTFYKPEFYSTFEKLKKYEI